MVAQRRKNNSWVGWLIAIVIIAIVVPSILAAGGVSIVQPQIMVIPVKGDISLYGSSSILGTDSASAEQIVDRIQEADGNPVISAIILEINSPGGTIAATQEIYNAVMRFKATGKKVFVSMGDIAASGGYYIASAADKIYANPGTITGSIGVIMTSPNLKGLYNWIRIKWNVIKSGRYKDILSPFRDLRPDERVLLIKMVQDAYQQFFDAVLKSGRLKRQDLIQTLQGAIFFARY